MPVISQEPRHYFEALTDTAKVDAQSGVIHRVSLISLGEARGHKDDKGRQIIVDATTLEQVFEKCKELGTVKVKVDHGSGVTSTVGYVDAFRMEKNRVTGDLNIYDSVEDTERNLIFEMAEKNPHHLGISMEFLGDDEIDGKKCLARCDEIITAALVSDPAANRSLFTRKTQTHTMPKKTTHKLESDEPKPATTEADPTPDTEAEPSIGDIAKKLSDHLKRFDEFVAGFSNKADVNDAPGTDTGKEGDSLDDNKTAEIKGEQVLEDSEKAAKSDADDDDSKKELAAQFEKVATLAAEKVAKAFSAKLGITIPAPGGLPQEKPADEPADELATKIEEAKGDIAVAIKNFAAVNPKAYTLWRNAGAKIPAVKIKAA